MSVVIQVALPGFGIVEHIEVAREPSEREWESLRRYMESKWGGCLLALEKVNLLDERTS